MIEIRLRDLCEQTDIEPFFRVHADAESMRYYGMMPFSTVEEAKKLFENYTESQKKGLSLHRVICDKTDDRYLGEIGIFNIDHTHHRANSYCILAPECRKQGVSQTASALFYQELFAATDINRIQASVDSRNENARKSLTGIGYRYEGTLKEYEFENGQFIDIAVYALLRNNLK